MRPVDQKKKHDVSWKKNRVGRRRWMPGAGPKKRRVCAPELKRKCGPRLKRAAGPRLRHDIAQKKSTGNARKKRLGTALRAKRAAWPKKTLGDWLMKHWNSRQRKKKLAG